MQTHRSNRENGRDAKKEAEGAWTQFKGRIREAYGTISDDELEKAKGRRDQVMGLIERASGAKRADVERLLDEAARKARYSF